MGNLAGVGDLVGHADRQDAPATERLGVGFVDLNAIGESLVAA
jgi:hypothetical protein